VPDDADLSDEHIALDVRMALAAAAAALATGPRPRGACLWCGARLALPQRWCDAECRDDWQRSQPTQPAYGAAHAGAHRR
jgi:hypothetical protein